MSALKAIFSRLQSGGASRSASATDGRRNLPDRRRLQRRGNVMPFKNPEAGLRFAAQSLGFGTYDLDCLTGNSHWSPELRALAGLPAEEAPLSIEEVEARVHPEDRESFMQSFRAALDGRGSGELEAECRLLRPDGTVRRVKVRGRTFFANIGGVRHPLGAAGVAMDVTASRAAENELLESRAELSGLIDAATDAIISIDNDQRIVLFNPAACRIFRCRADEAIGSPLARFIPKRYRAAHAREVGRFAEGGVTGRTMGIPGIFFGLRANGEEFPIEASIAKVQVDGHQRLTVFLRDVTERIRAEAALRQSRDDLELAVRGADIGIWSWDLPTGQVELSKRCQQLFGIPAEEALSMERVLAAIHPDDRKRVEAALRQVLEKGEEYKVEKRFVWPDGSVHWLECIGRELHDETSRQAVGMRGITLDITERKRQEEALVGQNVQLQSSIEDRTAELVRANEALERSNLELQQFAYIAAHDLQTPLRSISSFAQLLQMDYQGRLDPQADTWLDQLVRAAHRMRDVIHDILAYSRVESRGSAFQPTDFRQLFEDVAATLEAPIRESSARVTRGELPVALGDRTQLAQVLQNLIDNGLKYHRPGEPPEIHVSARREGPEWLFSVRDNGIGIAEKHLEQIFDIFRRLHTQEEYPGTGIGLAICRRVIHRHGGRIWAESRPGQGSLFRFTLPVERQGAAS